jgi:hypothetical protein
MVDFFFDNFYEVLSGEGIWVLILIGSALAVASFILLTMKIEVNPKPNKLNNVIQTAKKEENPVQGKSKKNRMKFKIKGRSRAEENTGEEEAHSAGATAAMPVRPEVVQPEDMEQVTVEMTDPDGFDIPSLPDIEDQASPLTDNTMVVTEDTQETEAGVSTDTMEEEDVDQEEEEETTDREESEEEENTEKAKGDSDTSSIFDIFNEVEEDDSGIAELAKNMEDVTINGLLSDTETLSEELKNIFSKFRRA